MEDARGRTTKPWAALCSEPKLVLAVGGRPRAHNFREFCVDSKGLGLGRRLRWVRLELRIALPLNS